ncbi:MAG: prepilin-type N-terminal cleavage/methylation domain-containing protein [Rubripirellula sp.]|nr:prepilin-type N-terminal cleavage/methylation domain-containing protein [Rubripirellula sp.]
MSRRDGFTLIEIVMVIMIIAIVAGLAVPLVGSLRRSANYAAQSSTTAAIGSNLEFFRTTYGNNGYPDGLDSLVLSSDNTAEISYVDSGFGRLIKPGTLAGDEAACFNWLSTVYDHTDGAFEGLQGNPGNTATTPRAFDGSNVALLDPDTTEGQKVLTELYPETLDTGTGLYSIPAGIQLVVLGIGRSNELVGRTMQSIPLDPRVDNSKVYGRYAAIFACYTERAGRRAQLKCVVNGKGRTTNDALSEFNQSLNPE